MYKSIVRKILVTIISVSMISVPLTGTVYGEEIVESDAEDENADTSEDTDTSEAMITLLSSSADSSGDVTITFDGQAAVINGSDSVTVDGSDPAVVSVTKSGTYTLSGEAENVKISVASGLEVSFIPSDLIVDNGDNDYYFIETGNNSTVNMDLTGSLTVNGGAGIISAPKSTVNISGDGSLTSEDASDDAIKAKKGTINIDSGSISVIGAAGDALKAKDGTVNINGGLIALTECRDDGIQAEDVNISGGILNIDTFYENAATGYYAGGQYTGSSSDDKNYLWESGDSVKYERINVDTGSHKGIKAGTKARSYVFSDDSSNDFTEEASGSLTITGGTITIDTRKSGLKANSLSASGYTATATGTYIIGSPDDAISCNNDISISGGLLNIYSGDDGISAMGTVDICGDSEINIYNSYEGIEGQTVNVGASGNPEITVYSCDDGINTSGKTLTYTYDTYAGYESNDEINYTKKSVSTSSGNDMNLYNGTIYVYIDSEGLKSVSLPDGSLSSLKNVSYRASGDGIDCNGSLSQQGGNLYVYGQSSGDNSPIDSNNGYTFESGAKVLGTGTDGMHESSPKSGSGSYITYGSSSSTGVPENNGNAPEGTPSEGNAPSGNPPEGNTPGGNPPEGNAPGGNPPEGNAPEGNAPDASRDNGTNGTGGSFSAGQYWAVLDAENKVVDYGRLEYSGSFIIYGSDTISNGSFTLTVVNDKPDIGDVITGEQPTEIAETEESKATGTFAIGGSTYEYSYTDTVSYNGSKLTLDDFTVNGKSIGDSVSGNVIFKKLRYKNNLKTGVGYAIPVFKAEKGADSTVKKAVKQINKYFRSNPLTFTIAKRSLENTNISGTATYYSKSGKWRFNLKADTGSSKTVKLKYKANGKGDFTVSSDTLNSSGSFVTITGTGNYSGTKEIKNVVIK